MAEFGEFVFDFVDDGADLPFVVGGGHDEYFTNVHDAGYVAECDIGGEFFVCGSGRDDC